MKDLLELVRKRYAEINTRLTAAKEEEKKFDSERERLAIEFTIADKAYKDACDHFDSVEKRIKERKEEYTKKQLLTHKKTLFSGAVGATTLGISIGMLAGAITNPLFLPIVGSAFISGLIDLKCSWKNMKKEVEEKFENLESTKRTRDISDKAYVNKLQREKKLRDIQGQIIDNKILLNLAKAKRTAIENEMMDVKVDTFDLIIDEKTEAQSLVLK